MEKVFVSSSREDTIKAAENLAGKFVGGEVVLLSGELGAGKTVFAKGVAKALGVAQEVTSPTFAIHNSYEGRLTLNHFDFYRLDETEAEVLGLDEFFGGKDSVCLIEWEEKIKEIIKENIKKENIEKKEKKKRKITIK